jgi:hypothetical protein
MSDDGAAVTEKKRGGRPAKADKVEKEETVKEAKKRGRVAVEKKEDKKKDEDEAPVKRGRGRPKGASKKAAAKPKVTFRL